MLIGKRGELKELINRTIHLVKTGITSTSFIYFLTFSMLIIWVQGFNWYYCDNNCAALWDTNNTSGGIPQLKGARNFSFEELKKCTNNFSEANNIGAGGYGMVRTLSLLITWNYLVIIVLIVFSKLLFPLLRLQE